MILALTLFGIGTIGCGIAPSMETLILARAIAGSGGGALTSVGSIIVTDLGESTPWIAKSLLTMSPICSPAVSII